MFKGLSVAKNILRPQNAPLSLLFTEPEHLYSFIIDFFFLFSFLEIYLVITFAKLTFEKCF